MKKLIKKTIPAMWSDENIFFFRPKKTRVNARVWYLKHARLLNFLCESRTIIREWEHCM